MYGTHARWPPGGLCADAGGEREAEASGLGGYRVSVRAHDGRGDGGEVVRVERLRGGWRRAVAGGVLRVRLAGLRAEVPQTRSVAGGQGARGLAREERDGVAAAERGGVVVLGCVRSS